MRGSIARPQVTQVATQVRTASSDGDRFIPTCLYSDWDRLLPYAYSDWDRLLPYAYSDRYRFKPHNDGLVGALAGAGGWVLVSNKTGAWNRFA